MILKINLFYVAISILVISNIIQISYCEDNSIDDDEDEGYDEEETRSCQKFIGDWVKGILKSALRCMAGRSTYQLNSVFEITTRANCLLKCILQEEGIVAMNGVFDDVSSALYFQDKFAPAVQDISLPHVQACFVLAKQFKPKEYFCQSYMPFIDCTFRAILKGLIPYGGDCVVNPTLGILFSTIKYLAPETPPSSSGMSRAINPVGLRKRGLLSGSIKRSQYKTKNNTPTLKNTVLNNIYLNATSTNTMGKSLNYKCLDETCSRLYEYKKVNGTKEKMMVVYDKNLQILSIQPKRKTKSKQKPFFYRWKPKYIG